MKEGTIGLGKWVAVNVGEVSGKTVEEFTSSISDEFHGIHALTLLKAMTQTFRKKDGYIVETATDNTLTLLKVRKGVGKDVDGVQVLTMENTKYSVSQHHFMNRHVLEDGEMDSIEQKLDEVRDSIENLTSGMVSFNTNDFVAQKVCRGLRMNVAGGTYFIPKIAVGKFETYVSELLRFLGPDSIGYVRIPVMLDKDGSISIAAAFKSNALSRLQEAMDKLDTYSTKLGVENRYEELSSLLSEISMYEDMLEFQMGDLRDKVSHERTKIALLLSTW